MNPLDPHSLPVAVTWDKRQQRPVAFVWRRRRYAVEQVLVTWVIDTGWWDESIRTSRRYFRVLSQGRQFELAFDRLSKRWSVERTLG